MANPFPGMNPWLERHWRDVHADLIARARSALNAALPAGLVARIEERVVIDSVNYDRQRAIYPDLRVYEDTHSITTGSQPAAAVAEPIILTFEAEEHTETFVTILDANGGELVTTLEVLSSTNKTPGEGRDQYRKKRSELIAAGVSVVEIDLIRAGDWRELLRPAVAPANVESAYRAVAWRASPRQVELSPLPLRRPLPGIRIPLRSTDADVTLNLQQLVNEAYDSGRYDSTDYTKSCVPSLAEEDAAWADELLKKAHRR